jgi:hypothetical protein
VEEATLPQVDSNDHRATNSMNGLKTLFKKNSVTSLESYSLHDVTFVIRICDFHPRTSSVQKAVGHPATYVTPGHRRMMIPLTCPQ